MNSKEFIIWWNNTFPYDRLYRKRYKIGLGSPEHRRLCQVDVKIDVVEELVFEEHRKEIELRNLEEELLERGDWIKRGENITSEQAAKLFDNLNLLQAH